MTESISKGPTKLGDSSFDSSPRRSFEWSVSGCRGAVAVCLILDPGGGAGEGREGWLPGCVIPPYVSLDDYFLLLCRE